MIKSDDKKRARLNALRVVLHSLPYAGKDVATIGRVDPLLVGRAGVVHERRARPDLRPLPRRAGDVTSLSSRQRADITSPEPKVPLRGTSPEPNPLSGTSPEPWSASGRVSGV